MSKKYKTKQKKQDYIDEMIEYQNNQFNPGYYVGTGKMPFPMKTSGNTMPFAIWMFIQAAGIIALYCFAIITLYFPPENVSVSFTNGTPLSSFISITLVFGVFIFICIWFGIIF